MRPGPDLTRNEWNLVRLALESHERAMFERAAFGTADATHYLRDRITAALADEGDPGADWFQRCDAVYEDAGSGMRERCGFPSLDSAAWHMHPDSHEGLVWVWGYDEVEARKEERRRG